MADFTPGPWTVYASNGPIREPGALATFWEVIGDAAGGSWIAHVQDIDSCALGERAFVVCTVVRTEVRS